MVVQESPRRVVIWMERPTRFSGQNAGVAQVGRTRCASFVFVGAPPAKRREPVPFPLRPRLRSLSLWDEGAIQFLSRSRRRSQALRLISHSDRSRWRRTVELGADVELDQLRSFHSVS